MATSDPLLQAKRNLPAGLDEFGLPETLTVETDGHSFVIEPGVTRLRSGHPLAKARPALFEPTPEPDGRKPKRRRTQ